MRQMRAQQGTVCTALLGTLNEHTIYPGNVLLLLAITLNNSLQITLFLNNRTLHQHHLRKTQEQLYIGKNWVCCPHSSLNPSSLPSLPTTTTHTPFLKVLRSNNFFLCHFNSPRGIVNASNLTCLFRCLYSQGMHLVADSTSYISKTSESSSVRVECFLCGLY